MIRISPENASGRVARRKIADDRSAARRMAREAIVSGGVVAPLQRSGLPRFLDRIAAGGVAPGRTG